MGTLRSVLSLSSLAQRGIRFKIVALTVVCIVITTVGLTVVSSWGTKSVELAADEHIEELTEHNIDSTLRGIYGVAAKQGQGLETRLQSMMNTGQRLIENGGGISLSDETAPWEVQQIDGVSTMNIPVMKLGDEPIKQVTSWDEEAVIVDDLHKMIGLESSIFQKIDESGTMLRIATSAGWGQETRKIGTAIPGKMANGTTHPIIKTILSGETFEGLVDLPTLNAAAVTRYAPITSDGEIVGMLGVGVALSDVKDLQELLNTADVGPNGLAEMISTRGDARGKIRLSNREGRDSVNILEERDTDGEAFAAKALEQLEKVPAGEFVTFAYNDPAQGARTMRLVYYPEWDWVIAVNTTYADFHSSVEHMEIERKKMMAVLLVSALLLAIVGAGIAWTMGGSISRPIRHLRDRMREISEGDGDLTARVAESDRDEVGQLGLAFNRFVSRVAETVRAAMDSARSVDEAAAAINVSTVKLSEGARVSAEQSAAAFDSAGEVNESVSTVASATQEMISSIQEISQSADEAARVGQQAGDLAAQTQGAVAALGTSSQEIGNVISVISSVAAQTNLLALNATIEAARAGDAGKGFAVVADEVKQLAQETAEATEEIARRVKAIQEDSGNAVGAIDQITEVVQLIMQHQTTIAAAVEEQSATTSEVSRGVDNAAGGVGQITDMTGRVGREAQSSAAGMEEIREAAESLAAVSGDLSRQLGAFKV